MFEYLEPEASDNQDTQDTNPGTGALPLSSGAGGNDRGTRSLKPPTPEKVRHMLYGSLSAIDRTIKILHALGYADPNDWSDPIPAPPAAETRSLRLRSATAAEPRSATAAKPQPATAAEPQSATAAEPQSATAAEPQSATAAEPRSATAAEPRSSSEAEPRSSSGVETPAVSGVETPAVSGVELWMAILTKTVLIE